MRLLSIRLLGDFAATDYRGDALSVGNRRTQALVVYLALRISGKTSMAEIGELLFGDRNAEANVRAVIRDLQYALRYLPPDILFDDGTAVRFNRETVEVDAGGADRRAREPLIKSPIRAPSVFGSPYILICVSRGFDCALLRSRVGQRHHACRGTIARRIK
jgi:DNA-binding SARP family transcriptional activator